MLINKTSRLLITALLALTSTITLAQKEVVMTGSGTMTCKKYMDTMQSLPSGDKEIITGMFEGWIQGYLSGRNRQLDMLGYEMVDIGNVEQFGAMLTFACGNAIKQGAGNTRLVLLVEKVYEDAFDTSKLKKK